MPDVFIDWNDFCNRADKAVQEYNKNHKDKCPFCKHNLHAFWNYDWDYEIGRIPHFSIECTNCSMSLKSNKFETLLAQLKGKENKNDRS